MISYLICCMFWLQKYIFKNLIITNQLAFVCRQRVKQKCPCTLKSPTPLLCFLPVSPGPEFFLERQIREILPPEFQFHTRERQTSSCSGFYYCCQGRTKSTSFKNFSWQPAYDHPYLTYDHPYLTIYNFCQLVLMVVIDQFAGLWKHGTHNPFDFEQKQ